MPEHFQSVPEHPLRIPKRSRTLLRPSRASENFSSFPKHPRAFERPGAYLKRPLSISDNPCVTQNNFKRFGFVSKTSEGIPRAIPAGSQAFRHHRRTSQSMPERPQCFRSAPTDSPECHRMSPECPRACSQRVKASAAGPKASRDVPKRFPSVLERPRMFQGIPRMPQRVPSASEHDTESPKAFPEPGQPAQARRCLGGNLGILYFHIRLIQDGSAERPASWGFPEISYWNDLLDLSRLPASSPNG